MWGHHKKLTSYKMSTAGLGTRGGPCRSLRRGLKAEASPSPPGGGPLGAQFPNPPPTHHGLPSLPPYYALGGGGSERAPMGP